jgi:hypothetical protein
MKYEIVDLSKSLFQEIVLIEASSPKVAAEKHFGFSVERCIGQHGYILVASKSYPCKTYLYKRHLTQRGAVSALPKGTKGGVEVTIVDGVVRSARVIPPRQ